MIIMLWLISGIVLIGVIEYIDRTEIQSMQKLIQEKEREQGFKKLMEDIKKLNDEITKKGF